MIYNDTSSNYFYNATQTHSIFLRTQDGKYAALFVEESDQEKVVFKYAYPLEGLTFDQNFLKWRVVNPSTNLRNDSKLESVAFGNDFFIAVGAGKKILRSTDGKSWETILSNASSTSSTNVLFANDLFVFGTGSDEIFTSENGIDWNREVIDLPEEASAFASMYSIAHGNEKFVMVGDEVIVQSESGEDWSVEYTTHDFRKIAFGNNVFVTIENYYDGSKTEYRVYSSVDGLDWTERHEWNSNLEDISFGNNTFVVLSGNDILTSTNGTNWTLNEDVGFYGINLDYDGSNFISIDYQGIVYKSSDGSSWNSSVNLSNKFPEIYGDIFFTNNRYFIFSRGGNIFSSAIFDNESSWELINSITHKDLDSLIEVNGELQVLAKDEIFFTLDGENWDSKNIGTGESYERLIHGNGRFVAVGSDGIATSTDGEVWEHTDQYEALDEFLNYRAELAFANSKFYILNSASEFDSSTSTSFYTSKVFESSDGESWSSPITLPTSEDINDLRFVRDRLVAVGDNGALIISLDGNIWKDISTDIDQDLLEVRSLNGLFVAVGDDTLLVSEDGSTWENRYQGCCNDFMTSNYGNGYFLALSEDEALYSKSKDEDNEVIGSHEVSNIKDSIFFNNSFIAVGDDGIIMKADF